MSAEGSVWFYFVTGQQFGPVMGHDLRRMVGDGRLDSSALVWTDGMPGWEPAATALQSVQSGPDKLATQAFWSLALGLISIFGLFPAISLPAGIVGLVLGFRSRASSRRGIAIAGIVLSVIGLLVMAFIGILFIDGIRHVGYQEFMRGFFTD